jgi:hypothetical protein
MGLLGKFSSREAELPENFLPRGKQSFPKGKLRFPQKFCKNFLPLQQALMVLAAIKLIKGWEREPVIQGW